jgi:hypothetical protein
LQEPGSKPRFRSGEDLLMLVQNPVVSIEVAA